MKEYRCLRVTVNHDLRWLLQMREGNEEEWENLEGLRFYTTAAACESARGFVDQAENGEPSE
jgi:hypothetical protein